MQRTLIIFIIVIAIVLGIALNKTPQEQDEGDGHIIVFNEMPNIHKEGIYYQNKEVGQITDTIKGSKGIIAFTVSLDKAFVQTMGINVVFFPEHGVLSADRLQSVTPPLPDYFIFCGFSSKARLKWFKFRTLFNNRITSANRRALKLYRKSGLS